MSNDLDHYKQILLGFLSPLAETWSESGELGSDAHPYPGREERQGSRLLLRFFPQPWKAVTFIQEAFLFIVSCSFSTNFTFLLYNKASFLFAFLHLVNPLKRFCHIFSQTAASWIYDGI